MEVDLFSTSLCFIPLQIFHKDQPKLALTHLYQVESVLFWVVFLYNMTFNSIVLLGGKHPEFLNWKCHWFDLRHREEEGERQNRRNVDKGEQLWRDSEPSPSTWTA